VGELQGQAVARRLEQDCAPALDRGRDVAVQPGPRGGDVAAFALVGATPQGLPRFHAGAQLRFQGLVGAGGQHSGTEAMPHDELRVLREGLVDGGDGVAEIAMKEIGGGFQAFQCGMAGGGDGNSATVQEGHDVLLSLAFGYLRIGPGIGWGPLSEGAVVAPSGAA